MFVPLFGVTVSMLLQKNQDAIVCNITSSVKIALFCLATAIKQNFLMFPHTKQLILAHQIFLVMIQHIVMWQLADTAQGKSKSENAQIIKESLESLSGKIDGLLSIEVGVNHPETPASNYDVVLNCTFPSVEALNAYQVHPLHVAAAAYIKQVVCARVCVDYER